VLLEFSLEPPVRSVERSLTFFGGVGGIDTMDKSYGNWKSGTWNLAGRGLRGVFYSEFAAVFLKKLRHSSAWSAWLSDVETLAV